MVNITGSFASPSADATVVPQLLAPAGLIASVLDGFTIWKFLVTLFVGAVLYDQCMCATFPPYLVESPLSLLFRRMARLKIRPEKKISTNMKFPLFSQVPLPQGCHRWPRIQNPFYGPIPPIRQPQVHRIQGQMGQRRTELCLCLPQVSPPLKTPLSRYPVDSLEYTA